MCECMRSTKTNGILYKRGDGYNSVLREINSKQNCIIKWYTYVIEKLCEKWLKCIGA